MTFEITKDLFYKDACSLNFLSSLAIGDYQSRHHDGVPAGSDKAFNFEILLDGFEEEFDFPTRLVNVGNSLGIKHEIRDWFDIF